MYYSQSFIPSARTNKGTLILPPLQWQDWQADIMQAGIQAQENGIDDSKWKLIVVSGSQCQEACENSLYLTRQVNVALGRRADRVERYLVQGGMPDTESVTNLHQQYPRLHQATTSSSLLTDQLAPLMNAEEALSQSYILLADPLGNIMMYYTPEQTGNDMLDDLKNLLKLSNIG